MRTITFYSYKGGVGRSLALANIATRLAEFGRQVCMMDFDLEAPGLQYKFATQLANHAKRIDGGIVDYIAQFTSEGILADHLRPFSYSWFPYPHSCMTLLPAGNPNSSTYWRKLSSINWYDLLYENVHGLDLLLDLKEKIKREINPDYLLIDSRTGISEMSGIALSLFADEVVVLAANNRENLEGAKKIIQSVSDPEKMVLNKAPKVTFVLCRIPFTGSADDRAKEQNLCLKVRREFGSLIDDLLVIHSDRELEENEQLKIGYDKDESVAQIAKDYLDLFEKLTVKDFEPSERENFKKIKESEKYFQKASAENDPEERLKWLDKAIELNRINTDLHLSRAAIFQRRADWHKVIEACDEVLQFETLNLRPYEIKAHALVKLGQIPEAQNVYEEILRRDANRSVAKLGLAEIGVLLGNFDKSLHLLDELLEKDPLNAHAYVERASLKRRIGDHQDALADVYRALEIQFDNAAAFLVLAKTKADLDDKSEFYLNFERAAELKEKLDKSMEEEIRSDAVYELFLKEPKFLKILDKYRIQLPTEMENGIQS